MVLKSGMGLAVSVQAQQNPTGPPIGPRAGPAHLKFAFPITRVGLIYRCWCFASISWNIIPDIGRGGGIFICFQSLQENFQSLQYNSDIYQENLGVPGVQCLGCTEIGNQLEELDSGFRAKENSEESCSESTTNALDLGPPPPTNRSRTSHMVAQAEIFCSIS